MHVLCVSLLLICIRRSECEHLLITILDTPVEFVLVLRALRKLKNGGLYRFPFCSRCGIGLDQAIGVSAVVREFWQRYVCRVCKVHQVEVLDGG